MVGAAAISSFLPLTAVRGHGEDGKVQAATDARLGEMARDFEATFLSMLLKEMRQTLEPEGLFPGDTGDVQGGLFDLYLGQHLAQTGGIGLATAILRHAASRTSHGSAPTLPSPDPRGALAGPPGT